MEADDEIRRLQAALASTQLASDASALARTLLDHLPYMVWLKNADGVFLAVNEVFARAAGRTREQVLGRTDFDLWPEELARRYVLDDQSVIATGRKVAVEEPIADASGTRWIETFKAPVFDADAHVVGTVGIARDVTARKSSEEEQREVEARLHHAQKLESLGLLAGGIAHDFNNLLVGVLGNAEIAIRRLQGIPEAEGALEHIEDVRMAAIHAGDLARQMLAYSGRATFVRQTVALNEVIGDSMQLLRASVSKKASLQCDLDPAVGTVQADLAQLRQVIMNLVTNASDALGGEPGTIRVETGTRDLSVSDRIVQDLQLEAGRYAYLLVSDDGCGMSHDTRARMFEPFYTTKVTGRGLGLAAVQGIVRAHGGGIAVESTPGSGARFEVLLPVSDRPAALLENSRITAREWCGSGVVLLVDDDARVRAVTKAVLVELGFEVRSASNGSEAIAIYESEADAIDVVLLDMTMPDLSGEQVFERLRQIRSDAAIILCSGYHEPKSLSRLTLEHGAMFLQKPFSFEQLRCVLREALERPSIRAPR